MGSCPRVLAALADCQRKHERSKDADVCPHAFFGRKIALEQQQIYLTICHPASPYLLQLFCAGLTAAAGWCIFKGLCPAEGVRWLAVWLGAAAAAVPPLTHH